jgi:hypothetical protein
MSMMKVHPGEIYYHYKTKSEVKILRDAEWYRNKRLWIGNKDIGFKKVWRDKIDAGHYKPIKRIPL